ncbi:MAG TPA: hypothetical protein VHZ55_30830 [Bryobacteraceae bacterium]|jgi:hypothetical protein|nr:hypothetical protein [Bryobacteraceae bacterium]
MKKHLGLLAAAGLFPLALCFAEFAAAQEQSAGVTSPPKVLIISNETLKPGVSPSTHKKTEAAFVQAFSAAKWPEHYMAMDALSGRDRTIFVYGYDCFDSWQKDLAATAKEPTLSAALDSAIAADGALLESHELSAFTYRPDLSLRAPVDLAHMRYMDITIFHVRSGHNEQFDALAKMYIDAYQKKPDVHWAAFEKMYGVESGNRFIVITPRKSLAEVDQEMVDDKGFASAVGPDQMKKLQELTAAAVESTESHVFQINPKMSYAPEAMVKADPEFWTQK